MQLILLSGGSGKRLWPLSNYARSKQFLPLLQTPDGTTESMVQRVMRQIKESELDAEVTIAANTQQKDTIENQLGNNVDVVLEPEHRGTFPAIMLSVMHLAFEKKCSDNETVVVMPCDPYTGLEYYEAINEMAKLIDENVADMALMGIKPTYPSPKYGYIIPEFRSSGIQEFRSLGVSRFVEKAEIEDAEALVKEGAMWNGGVFAFKLGYAKNIAEKYLKAKDFQAFRSRFAELPKVSFDYEVVRNATNVAVVPYNGTWKDLGTWNTICEELATNAIGNVTLGVNNVNTHVINELGTPIFCDGLENTVVAASPDGILVSAKKTSETIKDYADQLTDRPMYEERRWGSYQVLNTQEFEDGFKALTKTITLKPGKNISYQIHHHRSEVWSFIDGEGLFVLDGKVTKVKRGDVVNIPAEHFHAVKALTTLTFIEVQEGGPLIEEDIERFDFDWSNN
ncbi:MAG: cupin domain-containing protein [Paludibacteraceae bacterium]|nr:cupin domain-containing protein [Paludibacteraceae bacterium]